MERRSWLWQGWPSPEEAKASEAVVQLLRGVGLAWLLLHLATASTAFANRSVLGWTAVVLVAGVVMLERARRSVMTPRQAVWLTVGAFTFDTAVVVGANSAAALSGAEPPWESLLFVVALGGFRLQLAGALAGWALAVVALVVPPLFTHEASLANELVAYRAGMIGTMGFVIGMLSAAQRTARVSAAGHLSALQEVDRWRTRLLGVLAHDLRSPIATAASLAETLHDRGDDLPATTRRRLSAQAAAQNRRAERLLDDLLMMARAETQAVTVRRDLLRLQPIAARAVEASGVRATIDVSTDLQACVDPERLDQALYNLLTNAQRHGAPPITVRARKREGGGVTVTVLDEGKGVRSDDQPRMFEAFEHGGNPASVGLGLWIVQRIAEAHGGVVRYRDNEPHGAQFELVLPPCPAGTE